MRQADEIRHFVVLEYIEPARSAGRAEVVVRAGDVHRAMNLANALPAVCSAIGSNKFESLASARQTSRSGPYNGANVLFTFQLLEGHGLTCLIADFGAKDALVEPSALDEELPLLDAKHSLVLVSCVKSKRAGAFAARDLYTSAWFVKTRHLVEASGARWFILSSLYGLVEPSSVIQPYDYTLNTQGVQRRREWARRVLDHLRPQLAETSRVVIFGGHRYREFLVGPLESMGIKVTIPMQNLRRGEQLEWLTKKRLPGIRT